MLKKCLVLCLLVLLAGARGAGAQEIKPVQLAVFNPVQLVPEEDSIRGLRLSLFYTQNEDVTGASLVWLGVNRSTGDVKGVEFGLGNWAEGSVKGAQLGMVNVVDGDLTGVQWGLLNMSRGQSKGVNLGLINYNEGSFKGFQWGLFNHAAEMEGLQLGLFNHTRSLSGLQVGLGNYNGNKDPLEFMIFVNWSF